MKTVTSSKKYVFEVVHFSDGTSEINRENTGFSVIEMLAIANLLTQQLVKVFDDGIEKVDQINLKASDSPIIHKP